MIYLISDNSYLKIGYAKDPKKRLHNIQTGNIKAELLRYKPGTLKDEKKLHEICKSWHVKREWFQNIPEVIKAFDDYNPFSDQELQPLKDEIFRIEKEYKTTGKFQLKFNSSWEELKQKIEEAVIPSEWKPWVESYENAILYDKLVKTLKGSTTENLHTLKKYYKINQTIIDFPFELYTSFCDFTEKEVIKLESELEIIKDLKNDMNLVKSSISKELISYQLQKREQNLEIAISNNKFHIDTFKRMQRIIALWIDEMESQNSIIE